jgi:hypothetical protein
MPRLGKPRIEDRTPRALCPECGVSVPVVGIRWLIAHRADSTEYAFPRGSNDRCPGSLLRVPGAASNDA